MQRNFNETPGSGSLSFLSTDLGIFRSISFLLAILLPVYWFIANHDQSVMEYLWSGKDPLGERLILSSIFLILFGVSWVSKWVQQRAFSLTIVVLYLLTAWSFHILALNEFSQDPLISTVIIAIITRLFFRSVQQLFFYAVFAISSSLIAFFLSDVEVFRLIILLVVLGLTFLGIYFWLSQRINVRKSLARNEGLLHSILGFSSEFIFLVEGTQFRISNCNDHIPEFFPSLTKENLLDKELTEAIPEIFSPSLTEEVKNALENGEDYQKEICLKEQTPSVWVALSARKAPFEDQNLWMFRLANISEMKQKEETLRFSDNILRNLNTLILAANEEGKIIYLSDAVEKILGYDKKSLMGDGWWQIRQHTDLEHSERNYVVEVAQGQQEMHADLYERRIRAKDGSEKWILWKDTVTREGTVIGIGQDITKNKKEQAMREVIYNIASASIESSSLQDLYRYVHAEIAKAIPSANFYISLLDKAAKKIHFPYYVDDTKGGEIESFSREFGNGISEYCIKNHVHLMATGEQIHQMANQGEIVLHGGTVPRIWMGVPLIFEGEALGVLALQDYQNPYAYDEEDLNFLKLVSNQIALVIRKKQSEEALISSEAEFRGIFAQASVGIAKMTPEGNFAEVNDRICAIFGREEEDLKSQNIFDLMLPVEVESSVQAFNGIVNEEEAALSIQRQYLHQNGSVLHLHLYASLVKDSQGNPKHLITVFDDVTEIKRAEEEATMLR